MHAKVDLLADDVKPYTITLQPSGKRLSMSYYTESWLTTFMYIYKDMQTTTKTQVLKQFPGLTPEEVEIFIAQFFKDHPLCCYAKDCVLKNSSIPLIADDSKGIKHEIYIDGIEQPMVFDEDAERRLLQELSYEDCSCNTDYYCKNRFRQVADYFRELFIDLVENKSKFRRMTEQQALDAIAKFCWMHGIDINPLQQEQHPNYRASGISGDTVIGVTKIMEDAITYSKYQNYLFGIDCIAGFYFGAVGAALVLYFWN